MTDIAAATSTSIRTVLHISFDISDVGSNILDLSDELKADGSNKAYIARRIEAEMTWLKELLDELEARR